MVFHGAMVDVAGCAVGGTVAFTVGEVLATISVAGSTDAVVGGGLRWVAVSWGCVIAAVGAVCWVDDSAAPAVCVQTMLTYKQLRLGFKI